MIMMTDDDHHEDGHLVDALTDETCLRDYAFILPTQACFRPGLLDPLYQRPHREILRNIPSAISRRPLLRKLCSAASLYSLLFPPDTGPS